MNNIIETEDEDFEVSDKIGPLGSDAEWPMFSFARPAQILWDAVANAMYRNGKTEDEIEEWLQSKESRWALDGELGDALIKVGTDYVNDILCFVRLDMAKASVDLLHNWGLNALNESQAAKSNLHYIKSYLWIGGEAVVTIPSSKLENFRTNFADAIVEPPANMSAERQNAWDEANRMQAHVITLPVDSSVREVYMEAAQKLLRLVREN